MADGKKHRVEGGVNPDGVVGPSTRAQISTDSTSNPGITSPEIAMDDDTGHNAAHSHDQDQTNNKDELDKMKTNSVSQYHPNMNYNKNNRNNNTPNLVVPELNRIQHVGNVEWLEGLMGKVNTWETITANKTPRPSGVEEVEDSTQAELMMIAAKVISGVDVTEIYSPERVVRVAKAMGLKGVLSLDLTNEWNFNLEENRQGVWDYIVKHKSLVVIGSPMCTMFSTLQNMRNISSEGDAKYNSNYNNALEHLKFCINIYKHQDKH